MSERGDDPPSEPGERPRSETDDSPGSKPGESPPSERSGVDDVRHATLRTSHEAPEIVAAALRPDNTAEMATRVVDGLVETTIGRPTTGGLRTTVDDYVVNCSVADRVVQHADRHTPTRQ